ncbi:hypothetical protein ACFFRR_002770 [Megaselia abdita]
MNVHRNRKNVGLICVGLIALYLIFSSGWKRYEIEAIIKNAKAEDVWNYVADFSKMRILNPTITNFVITAESGNREHWKYSVLYTERLSHWPYWENKSTADFDVKRSSHLEDATFLVESLHKTCFFGGLYCLHSKGEFRFNNVGGDTYANEVVQYQCPPFFGSFCTREVVFQRKAIVHNLTVVFSK